MPAKTSVTLTFGFKDETTRKYKFDDVANAALSGIATKCKAINASLLGGTAGGLSTFFLSDDGENFTSILAAQSDNVDITDINLI